MTPVELAIQTAKILISYYPGLIPCLFAFYYESVISLKLWKAALLSQHCESRDASGDDKHQEPEPGQIRWNGEFFSLRALRPLVPQLAVELIKILVICSLIVLFIKFFLSDVQQRTLLLYVLYVPFTIAVMSWKFIMVPFGGCSRHVTFNKQGLESCLSRLYELLANYTASSDPKMLVKMLVMSESPMPLAEFVILPVVVVIAALWLEHPLTVLIVYMGILYVLTLVAFPIPLFVKFKAFFWIATVMDILGITVVFFYPPSSRDNTRKLASAEDNYKIGWIWLIISAIYLLPSFIILCMLLRFDCIKSSPIDDREQTADINPDQKNKKPIIVSITHRIPEVPRPYHTLAFCILSATFIALAVFSAVTQIKPRIEEMGFLVGSITTLGMIYGALVLAAMRGELEDLWAYEDAWEACKKRCSLSFRLS
ncbi:hypothetical protein ACEPAH_2752 [Sanghuangporus vaninii]